LSLFRILPASTADIANVLFEMNPMKFIKGETLSALIYLSNIHHDSNTLVIDNNHGILAASVLQRCLIPI